MRPVIPTKEKDKLAAELVVATEEKDNRAAELVVATEEKDNLEREVTMRIDAEKKMRQFKSTLDLTDNQVFMIWPDTLKFFYVNQAAQDQLGWNDEELYNMTLHDIVTNTEGAELREKIKSLIEAGVAITFKAHHQRRNGELIPVEIHAQYIVPADENPRIVGIVRDITERLKADKAKAEFISTVSHELRTPLTSIKGVLGLIRGGIFDKFPEKLHSVVNIAYANCGRLELLINSILEIEQISAGIAQKSIRF